MSTQPRPIEGPVKTTVFERMSAADFNRNYASLVAVKDSTQKKARRRQPEEDLQRACFEWVFRHEKRHPELKWLFHPANGGSRSKADGGKLKATGVRKGVVDVINPFPAAGGPGLALELKAPKGKLTTEQTEFLQVCASHGWVTATCFSLDQFITCVRLYLGVASNVRME